MDTENADGASNLSLELYESEDLGLKEVNEKTKEKRNTTWQDEDISSADC